jgi:hypothetical protein
MRRRRPTDLPWSHAIAGTALAVGLLVVTAMLFEGAWELISGVGIVAAYLVVLRVIAVRRGRATSNAATD